MEEGAADKTRTHTSARVLLAEISQPPTDLSHKTAHTNLQTTEQVLNNNAATSYFFRIKNHQQGTTYTHGF